MATYFVASGGSNTSPYDTWAKAATSLATALAAASSGSDVVVIQYNAVPTGDAELAVDTTYTTANSVRIISASNDGGSAYTPTVMGTANWIGNSTTNRFIRFDAGADDRVYVYGLTLRTAGTTSDALQINSTAAGGDMTLDSCYLWHGNTGSTQLSVGGNSNAQFTRFVDCTFRLGATGQSININSRAVFENMTLSSAGSAPTNLFNSQYNAGSVDVIGGDLSHCTGTLVANAGNTCVYTFMGVKLGAGVVPLATQTTNPNSASPSVFLVDCNSGDTHGFVGYYDALGSCVNDTGIYFTTGAAGLSWKIVTTANASFFNPFITPTIDLYHTGTSAITPYLEILRDGSATAYQDDEVWIRLWVKDNTGFVNPSFYDDRCTLATKLSGTPSDQAAGAGTGSWTGEGGTAWSGKCGLGSSVTPAESGYIRAELVVGEPSITVYVDPQIRT